jgi:hypothetical protein
MEDICMAVINLNFERHKAHYSTEPTDFEING